VQLLKNPSSEELKNRAVENLFEKTECFGIQEYFDESLILFADTLGWSMPFYEYQNRKDVVASIWQVRTHRCSVFPVVFIR